MGLDIIGVGVWFPTSLMMIPAGKSARLCTQFMFSLMGHTLSRGALQTAATMAGGRPGAVSDGSGCSSVVVAARV